MSFSQVVVVMGSRSDLKIMRAATEILQEFGISVQTQILSAHRTPELLQKSTKIWSESGVKVIIAGAGGAAHLPGMLASFSALPVIGVPISNKAMDGLDSLLSIAQMPRGVPVATVGVDNSVNAGLLALEILALADTPMGRRLSLKIWSYKRRAALQVKKDRKNLKKMTISKFLKLKK